ncbi:MAG: glycosyltransferase N-terminal domain-containing protein [Pseudomonadota bacterium]
MGRSFGLAAYRAFSRKTSVRTYKPSAPRPNGTVLWIHAASTENVLAIEDLAARICAVRHDLFVLITLPEDALLASQRTTVWSPDAQVCHDATPSEHPDAVTQFWSHWSPDMVIWTWGNLRPNVLNEGHKRGCPMVLIDADSNGFDSRIDRWLPELSGQLLAPFLAHFVRSGTVLHRLEALGVRLQTIDVTPPLLAGGQALPCAESDLTELSATLTGRPVWLACNLHPRELPSVLGAHRRASRMSHRLLLIVQPERDSDEVAFTQPIAEAEFRYAHWDAGEEPDDTTQILFASDPRDLGLFYRIAPVTFMGGSLTQGCVGRNPFEAATLGSAVLYGPNVRAFMPFYTRLAKAGAARIVKDEETLAAAVTHLIAPDEAAAMAHAGWDVISQGADLTDRVISLVQSVLDGEMEYTHAPT